MASLVIAEHNGNTLLPSTLSTQYYHCGKSH